MIMRSLYAVLIAGTLIVTGIAQADPLTITKEDDIKSVLTDQIGKKITVHIKSGQELSGTVTAVSDELTHLSELTGKEFYDAVITNKSIEAVIIRAK